MSEELKKLVEKIDNTVGRRGFLGKLAAASAALVASVLGFAPNTEGLVSACRCCVLCRANSGSCSGCVCTWTWNCCSNESVSRVSSCSECYNNFPGCVGGCVGVTCSWCRISGLTC